MISSAYAKAYKEILEIIKYFPQEEYVKIPKEIIEFYQENMDKDYEFKINPEIDISKQNISPETNAIIVNLFLDYYANEEQKVKIKKILDLNQQKAEEAKREKYNPDNIFKNVNKYEKNNEEMFENKANMAIIEYQESFFTRFKKFIFKILHIN